RGTQVRRGAQADSGGRLSREAAMTKCLSALVLVGSVLLSCEAATANVFTMTDYEKFYQLQKRITTLGGDLANLIIKPPWPTGSTESALRASTHTQDCMIRLSGDFGIFGAQFDQTTLLVGLAAKMVSSEDEMLVLSLLAFQSSMFVEHHMKVHERLLSNT